MTPANEFEPTITTANKAQSKLGIVRIRFRSIRVGQRTHGGATFWEAPREIRKERTMARRVETRAIWTVSRSPDSVLSKIDQSGGKN